VHCLSYLDGACVGSGCQCKYVIQGSNWQGGSNSGTNTGFYGLGVSSPTERYECDSCTVCGSNGKNNGGGLGTGKTRYELDCRNLVGENGWIGCDEESSSVDWTAVVEGLETNGVSNANANTTLIKEPISTQTVARPTPVPSNTPTAAPQKVVTTTVLPTSRRPTSKPTRAKIRRTKSPTQTPVIVTDSPTISPPLLIQGETCVPNYEAFGVCIDATTCALESASIEAKTVCCPTSQLYVHSYFSTNYDTVNVTYCGKMELQSVCLSNNMCTSNKCSNSDTTQDLQIKDDERMVNTNGVGICVLGQEGDLCSKNADCEMKLCGRVFDEIDGKKGSSLFDDNVEPVMKCCPGTPTLVTFGTGSKYCGNLAVGSTCLNDDFCASDLQCNNDKICVEVELVIEEQVEKEVSSFLGSTCLFDNWCGKHLICIQRQCSYRPGEEPPSEEVSSLINPATSMPSVRLSTSPTAEPTKKRKRGTKVPTTVPTLKPTKKWQLKQTIVPTSVPTLKPTKKWQLKQTIIPTSVPSLKPSKKLQLIQTSIPTLMPSAKPTNLPTKAPVTESPVPLAPSNAPILMLPVGEACIPDDIEEQCLKGTSCALESGSSKAKTICCNASQLYNQNKKSYCGDLALETPCLNNVMCASSRCNFTVPSADNITESEVDRGVGVCSKKVTGDVCETNANCEQGACGRIFGFGLFDLTMKCCPDNSTIVTVGFGSQYCGELSLGSPCLNDEFCLSDLQCTDRVCAGSVPPALAPTEEENGESGGNEEGSLLDNLPFQTPCFTNNMCSDGLVCIERRCTKEGGSETLPPAMAPSEEEEEKENPEEENEDEENSFLSSLPFETPCFTDDMCIDGLVCVERRCKEIVEGTIILPPGGEEESSEEVDLSNLPFEIPCFSNDMCRDDLVCIERRCIKGDEGTTLLPPGGEEENSEEVEGGKSTSFLSNLPFEVPCFTNDMCSDNSVCVDRRCKEEGGSATLTPAGAPTVDGSDTKGKIGSSCLTSLTCRDDLVCTERLCAETPLFPSGEVCERGDQCIDGVCAFESAGFRASMVCCLSGDSVIYENDYYCAGLSLESKCHTDEMCMNNLTCNLLGTCDERRRRPGGFRGDG